MSTILYVISIWCALSLFAGLAFCWLLKTGRISFAPIEDCTEFEAHWLEKRP